MPVITAHFYRDIPAWYKLRQGGISRCVGDTEMRWNRVLLFGLTSVLTLWTACGGERVRPKSSKNVLRISRAGFEAYDRWLKRQISTYEETHPGEKVSYEPVPGQEYLIKIQTAIAAGNEPDVYTIAGQWVPKFARENLLDVPPEEIQQIIREEYVSAAVDYCSYEGVVYGFPYEGGSRVVLYNKELVEEAGITRDPESWEELALFAQRCTKFDKYGRMIQQGIAIMGPGLHDDFMCQVAAFIWMNGGGFMNEDETEFLLEDPRTVEALQYFVDLIYKYKCTSLNFISKPEAFATGRAAYYIGGPWDVSNLKVLAPDMELGACLIPPKEKGGPIYVDNSPWVWVVSNSSTHKAQGYEFIQHIQTKEAQLHFATEYGITPYRRDALQDPFFTDNPIQAVFAESNKYIRMRPRIWFFEISRMLGLQFEMALLKMKTPMEAMRDGIRDIKRQMRIRQESR